ncbi:MAG: peptidylprolyl isomerase [Phycisphaeraceae bacterium]|nr:peptidylprolyl isomerase [Phycisphaeraceae bacterium]
MKTIHRTDSVCQEMFQPLEQRLALAVQILTPISNLTIPSGTDSSAITLTGRYENPDISGTIAQFNTSLGPINVLLFDEQTPATVANFLRYITEGLFDSTIIHRSLPGFVIQGGGFFLPDLDFDEPRSIPPFDPVVNEPGISNTRGTIAMAKRPDDPDSATNQWFFNLGDNSGNLDNQNGGFTVFGRVIDGLDVMDAIAAVPVFRFPSPFEDLPLRTFADGEGVDVEDYIAVGIETRGDLRYSVTSSNPDLVDATVDGETLNLSYALGQTGASTITLRVTSADGTFVEDVFVVRIGNDATIGRLVTNPAQTVNRGAPLTLIAENVDVPDGSVLRVEFYRDVDGDGIFNPSVDSLLGVGTASGEDYILQISTDGFGEGAAGFFARAFNAGEEAGPSTFASVNVRAVPVIGTLVTSPVGTVRGGDPLTLTVQSVDAPETTTARVQFFLDSNGNGEFDADADQLLGESDTPVEGRYSLTLNAGDLSEGVARFFARAVNGFDLVSEVVTATVSVFVRPTVGALVTPTQDVLRRANVVLSAVGIQTFQTPLRVVEFYRDVNGDGVITPGVDQRVGTSSSRGTPSVRVSTKSLPLGETQFLARAIDRQGLVSDAAAVQVQITNNPPTLRTMKINLPVIRYIGEPIDITVGGSRDIDGRMASVRYYLDSDGDGVLNPETDRLLGEVAGVRGNFKLRVSSEGFALGINRIFAVPVDNDGTTGTPLNRTTYLNRQPELAALTITEDGIVRQPYTFTASGVIDLDGGVTRVEFWLDRDGNGLLENRLDRRLGYGKRTGVDTWSLTIAGQRLGAGTFTIMAIAVDNHRGLSPVRVGTVTLG